MGRHAAFELFLDVCKDHLDFAVNAGRFTKIDVLRSHGIASCFGKRFGKIGKVLRTAHFFWCNYLFIPISQEIFFEFSRCFR